jgi:glycosyltransferase involved in cell wall biosynthesis
MEGLFNLFMTHLSVVVPVFNEGSLIDELVKRVIKSVKTITQDFELIIVDDGSKDNTWSLIENEAKTEWRIKGIKFSRNFGHHYAITAGLHNSNGEWVVVMDGDLQDRPEVIPELYEKAQEGYDVVFVSRQNRQEGKLYLLAQNIFYLILRVLSGMDFNSRQANFSIISRKVVEAFKTFPENARFYGSTIKWLGFNGTQIFADHGQRLSGSPSYTIKKRIKLASDIIFSFSERPLKFAMASGILMALFSALIGMRVIYNSIVFGYSVVGWASLISVVFFSTGMILMVAGVTGIYVGKVFKEVKDRPLYIIDLTTEGPSNLD